MTESEISIEQRYQLIVDAFADDESVGRYGKGQGSAALKANGKMFAMLSKGRLVVKLPRARVSELVEASVGEMHDAGNGLLQKEWLAIDPASLAQWLPLAQEAKAFVSNGAR